MLNLYTIILGTFISLSAIASTHGGGVMMSNGKTMHDGGSVGILKSRADHNPEIVFNMGKQNGVIKFAYGQFVDNQWQIQNIEILEVDLINDVSVIKALENSASVNDWTQIN